MVTMPKWATSERTEYLRQLDELLQSGRCTDGDTACPVIRSFIEKLTAAVGKPEKTLIWLFRASIVTPRILSTYPLAQLRHFPNWLSAELIRYWKADDREMQRELWKREKQALHRLLQITHRGQFDSIARDEFFLRQPVFSIDAVGIGAFTLKPVAKVHIHTLHRRIWVDLTGIKRVSKNARHKYFRYHRGVAPKELREQIESRCLHAVKEFLG